MEGRTKNTIRSLILPALLTAALVLLSALPFDFYYDLNDDFMMAHLLDGTYTGSAELYNIQSLFPLTWKTGKGEGYANASYSYSDANEKMTKYCISSYEGKDGFVDNKTVLDPEDDVAHVKLGGSWRMPTIAEVEELWSKCSNVWVTVNGVGGFRLTGPNGNTIFLPQTRSIVLGELQDSDGYGSIWSSSLDTSVSSFAKVYVYSVSSRFTNSMPRYLGYAVRPVYAE